ncbi:MAG: hypothetical protein ACLGGX_01425, partial [Bdellovibrionia bacterium]
MLKKTRTFQIQISHFKKFALLTTLAFITLVSYGCDGVYWDHHQARFELQQRAPLKVITVRNPITFNKAKNGATFGIEHDLLEGFARKNNLKIEFKAYGTPAEAQDAFERGEGDILANRTLQLLNNHYFSAGPAYEETTLALYCPSQA